MFHRQNVRQPWAAALLALLLALASAFSCIGLSGWASFRRQLAALDAQYTTVAYGANYDADIAYNHLPKEYLDDGSILFENGEFWASPNRVNALAEQAPGLLGRNTNVLTAAYTPNQKGLSSGAVEPTAYVDVYDEGRYAMSVAAMRCLSVEENKHRNSIWTDYYIFRFEWLEPVCRMSAYDLPEHSKVLEFLCNVNMCVDKDGNPRSPFETGKTYLFRGMFKDFRTHYWWIPELQDYGWYRQTQETWHGSDPVTDPNNLTYWQRFDTSLPLCTENGASLSVDGVGHPYPLNPNFYLDARELSKGSDSLNLHWSASVPEGSWPLYSEYEGDWRDFLETEEGRVWRDEIIPCCERSHDSVAVLLTDNIQGLSQFCQEESALLEGRFITREEYDRGDAVCLVGADYALFNGLSVGDTITLDLYKPAYFTSRGGIGLGAQGANFYYTCCMPLAEENRLGVTRDYTIVGLYSAPARPCDPDGHGFRGDTVLAPKASAPEVLAAAEEDRVTPLLNTLVLKNGSIGEFEAYMADNGAAGRFRYYDYGYSEMKSSVEAMEASALRLAALGGAAFLIGAAVFLLAGFARMTPSARGLRLLGASPRRVAGEMLAMRLAVLHNLYFYNRLMARIRDSLEEGSFSSLRRTWSGLLDRPLQAE